MALLYKVLQDKLWWFLLTETIVILSWIIGWLLYRKMMKPFELMKTGLDTIKDEDFTLRFVNSESGDIRLLIEVFNKMLSRLSAERVKVQEQGYLLESIIEASTIGMILLDYDDRITLMNKAAQKMLSISPQLQATTLDELHHPIIKGIRSLTIGKGEILKDGLANRYRCEINSVIHQGFPRRFVMIEELSHELLTHEKAAYGRVIRIMSHEVNNSLGAVNSILQMAVQYGFKDEELADIRESLLLAHDRNEELANFVKKFAELIRLPLPQKQAVNILSLTKNIIRLMSTSPESRSISFQIHDPGSDVIIACDEAQIKQVLINILKNAIEAIDGLGQIDVYIQHVAPQIRIEDNGPGLTPQAEDQLFANFFSTKPAGQGIGLILVRDILSNHGASFSLYRHPQKAKTVFDIRF